MISSVRTLVTGVAVSVSFASAGSAQALFDGCPSEPILQRLAGIGQTGQMPPDLGRWLNRPGAQCVEPWSPFENVDYLGIFWVSAWLVHTDADTVLIDTLCRPFRQTLIDNIEKTGADLSDIRYVLMTHGHFDHVGGAAALKSLLPNATFVMTQGGWDEALKSAAATQGTPRAWEKIEPEMVVADGVQITLGENTLIVVETPGHTWGTASYIYDVRDGDDIYRTITIGGLGLNAIEGPTQVEAYIESVERVRSLADARDMGIEVHLTTHGFSNSVDEDRQALAVRAEGEPNVLVNPDGLLSQFETVRSRAVEGLETERANQ